MDTYAPRSEHRWVDADNGSLTVIRIHVIEPHQAGVGVHQIELPDYLLLNTVCGQLDLFGSRYFSGAKPSLMLSFWEWLRRENYTVGEDGQFEVSGAGRAVQPDDFLPRNIFGRYLAWVYQTLANTPIPGVEVILHASEALSIKSHPGGERIVTAHGELVSADHVFLTTGHTANAAHHAQTCLRQPYPVAETLPSILAGSDIAVAGIGLVAIDVITALTAGRGGRFTLGERPNELCYQPSGNEPRIHLYSRNGLPFFCRPLSTLDSSGV